MKNEKNGQLDIKQQKATSGIKHVVLKHVALIVGLFSVAAWFLAIFGIAIGLSWALHFAELHATWVSTWVFKLGHFAESLLFVGDYIAFVVGILKELWEHVFKDMFEQICKKCAKSDKSDKNLDE